MRSRCDLIGQCLINNKKTIESKDHQSRSRESSLFCYGGTGRHRKMAAYFCRAVQGGVVGKGLTACSCNASHHAADLCLAQLDSISLTKSRSTQSPGLNLSIHDQ